MHDCRKVKLKKWWLTTGTGLLSNSINDSDYLEWNAYSDLRPLIKRNIKMLQSWMRSGWSPTCQLQQFSWEFDVKKCNSCLTSQLQNYWSFCSQFQTLKLKSKLKYLYKIYFLTLCTPEDGIPTAQTSLCRRTTVYCPNGSLPHAPEDGIPAIRCIVDPRRRMVYNLCFLMHTGPSISES